MNLNQLTSFVSMGLGIILSLTVSVNYFLLGGFQTIVSNAVIVNNKVVIDDSIVLYGLIRMGLAGVVFVLIFNFFLALSAHYWASFKRETE